MNINIITEDKPYGEMMEQKKIHLVLPASESLGFGMTRAYLRFNCKMDDHTVERFINQVNDKNAVGSLYPRFSLAVFPTKKEYFSQYIKEIFELETRHVKSKYLVFDFFANSFDEEDLEKFINQLKEQALIENEIEPNFIIEVRTKIKHKD